MQDVIAPRIGRDNDRAMTALGPNARLIGKPGSRAALDTPALLVDRDALERNIAAMAAHARAAGVPGVHITSPQVTEPKIARLIALHARPHDGLSIVVDHPGNLAALARAARQAGKPLDVLVDFSAGHGRTGCADEASLASLAREAVNTDGIILRGIQSYSGNLQHIPMRDERRSRALAQLERLRGMVTRLRDAGIDVPIVSGAGTGTFDLDPAAHVFTELQVGSYVFMDVDYLRAMKDGRNAPPFETALFVATAVVSAT